MFKLNVDAAINQKDQLTGLRAVIKDSRGKITAACIKQAQLKESVSFAEAEAIERGLPMAKSAALSCLIVETNCQQVADLMNNTTGSRKGIYWIIDEIQNQKRDFEVVKFRYISRTCNACAHVLAKVSLGANIAFV